MENYTNKNTGRTNLLPVIPLRGKVAFPHTLITFEVGREMTLKAVERASATEDKLVLICTQRVTEKDVIGGDDLYETGCVARIKQIAKLLLLTGLIFFIKKHTNSFKKRHIIYIL